MRTFVLLVAALISFRAHAIVTAETEAAARKLGASTVGEVEFKIGESALSQDAKNDLKDTELQLLSKTDDEYHAKKVGGFDPEAIAQPQQAQEPTNYGNLGIILTLLSVFCNLGFSALRKLIPEVSSTQYMFD